MQQYHGIYMDMHTIVIADSKENARRIAGQTLKVAPRFHENIAVVAIDAEGKVG